MKRVLRYAKPYTLIIILALAAKFAAAVLELQIPTYLASILDEAVPIARENGSNSIIYSYGLRMLLVAFLAMACNMTGNVLSSFSSSGTVRDLRQALFVKLTNLSATQMDELTIPSAVSRLTSDSFNVNAMFTRMLRTGVRAPILMIGGIFFTLTMDPVLAIVLLIALAIISYVAIHFTRKSVPMFKKRQAVLDDMIRTVQENVTGIRVIKALSKSEYERQRYDKVNNDLADRNMAAKVVMAINHPLTHLILNLSLVGVVLIGAMRVNSGLSQSGKIIAFINYFTIIINATLNISGIFMILSDGVASADRISNVMDLQPDMKLQEILPEKTEYAVEFRDVSFSYNGVENNISHLSFRLKKGQTLGIIGSTGSGKTTILNLLMRFYDVNSGKILLNGRDIRSIPNEELRSMFGVTLQNDFLVGDTIANNISYYRDLSREQLEKAAFLAQAEEFIRSKDGGLDHMLNLRGNNLSGGQKQRVLIARALAANPEILILDDASSALDYRTDAELRRALAGYTDTTKIIVAQRISSIQSADCILVLDNGEVIGQGTHEELMQTCPDYQEIAQVQMETEEEVPSHA